jgi:hypothetical protein
VPSAQDSIQHFCLALPERIDQEDQAQSEFGSQIAEPAILLDYLTTTNGSVTPSPGEPAEIDWWDENITPAERRTAKEAAAAARASGGVNSAADIAGQAAFFRILLARHPHLRSRADELKAEGQIKNRARFPDVRTFSGYMVEPRRNG